MDETQAVIIVDDPDVIGFVLENLQQLDERIICRTMIAMAGAATSR